MRISSLVAALRSTVALLTLFWSFTGSLAAQPAPTAANDPTQVVVFVVDGDAPAVAAMKKALARTTMALPDVKVHFYEGKWEFYAHWMVSITVTQAADATDFFFAAAYTKPETGWNPVSPAMQRLANHACIPHDALQDAMDRSMSAVNDFKSMFVGFSSADGSGFTKAAGEITAALNEHYVRPAVARYRAVQHKASPLGLQSPKPPIPIP